MKQVLRRILRKSGFVVAAASNSAVRYLDSPPACAFDDILLRVFPRLQGLRFVQVGANDGVQADPILRYIRTCAWEGILLEPVPAYFRELSETHRNNPRLLLVNAAIDEKAGQREIFQLDPAITLPTWVKGLASFDRDRLLAAAGELHLGPESVVSEIVATKPWSAVWSDFRERHGDAPCDVLVLDTEGFDITLLRAADLERNRPRVIHFEHACNPLEERLAFYRELFTLGYEISTSGGDTIAHRCS